MGTSIYYGSCILNKLFLLVKIRCVSRGKSAVLIIKLIFQKFFYENFHFIIKITVKKLIHWKNDISIKEKFWVKIRLLKR